VDRHLPRAQPGRSCPLHYRYAPSVFARPADVRAEILYVVGGLYGNRPALDAVLELAANDDGPVMLVFNGDFNWFNIDPESFAAINTRVLQHKVLRGNVETEIAGDDDAAGCGCGYPAWVSDAEVARSNVIIGQLRNTACNFPALREQLAALPMHLVAEVGGTRVAIVHGDAHSLAGWDFAQEVLSDAAHRTRIASEFAAADARIFASSHTCLPVAHAFDTPQGECAIINNGAAGMPNFSGAHFGVITRIATLPSHHIDPIYALRVNALRVEALPLHYDHPRWLAEFLANWPAGTAAHASYFQRITEGPAYTVSQAVCAGRELQPAVATTLSISRSM
jgi:hypothetical protein